MIHGELDSDPPTFGRELNRVGEDIEQNLLALAFNSSNRWNCAPALHRRQHAAHTGAVFHKLEQRPTELVGFASLLAKRNFGTGRTADFVRTASEIVVPVAAHRRHQATEIRLSHLGSERVKENLEWGFDASTTNRKQLEKLVKSATKGRQARETPPVARGALVKQCARKR